MIFLIFGILSILGSVSSLILCFVYASPIYAISLVSCIISAVFFFTLYYMKKDIARLEDNISILQKSLNECRDKLGLAPLEKEYPDEDELEEDEEDFDEDDFDDTELDEDELDEDEPADFTEDEDFDELNEAQDDECPNCFSHVESYEEECPNCGYKLK